MRPRVVILSEVRSDESKDPYPLMCRPCGTLLFIQSSPNAEALGYDLLSRFAGRVHLNPTNNPAAPSDSYSKVLTDSRGLTTDSLFLTTDNFYFNATIKLVTIMFASASGRRNFQPNAINWSYRKRGNVPRTQI